MNALEIESRRKPRRDGANVLIPREAILPPFCIRCGEPTEVYKEHTFVFVIGCLLYELAPVKPVNVERKMVVAIPLCAEHVRYRTFLNRCSVVLLIGAVPLCLLVGKLPFDWAADARLWVGLATFVASMIAAWKAGFLHLIRLDESGGTFAGVGEEYLWHLEAASPEHKD